MDIVQCNLLVKIKRKVIDVCLLTKDRKRENVLTNLCSNLDFVTVEKSLGRFTTGKPRIWYVVDCTSTFKSSVRIKMHR